MTPVAVADSAGAQVITTQVALTSVTVRPSGGSGTNGFSCKDGELVTPTLTTVLMSAMPAAEVKADVVILSGVAVDVTAEDLPTFDVAVAANGLPVNDAVGAMLSVDNGGDEEEDWEKCDVNVDGVVAVGLFFSVSLATSVGGCAFSVDVVGELCGGVALDLIADGGDGSNVVRGAVFVDDDDGADTSGAFCAGC